MILGERFDAFVAGSPVSVMLRGSIENIFSEERIDAVFEETAEAQYTRHLRFSTVAELMSRVVFDIAPSIGAAYQEAYEEMIVSRRSLYNKLNGIEPQVSSALVRDSYERFAAVIAALRTVSKPLVKGYRAKILDGNHFASTEHRLKPLRTIEAAPLPGHALVVFDAEQHLVTTVIPCEDAHAQERSLLGDVLPLVEPGDLWIGDRNFSTTGFIMGIAERGASLLLRQHASLPIRLLGVRTHAGTTDTGEVYQQQIELSDPETGTLLRLRRITIELFKKTRNGEREIHLVSNLPEKVSAITIADLYLKRWTIETMFQELTETLNCEIKTLGYPKAAIFAFSLAVIAYNAISLVMAAIERVHGAEEAARLSRYYIAWEIATVSVGMMLAVPQEHWLGFRKLTARQLADLLCELATNVKLAKYQKHPRGPKKKQPKRTSGTSPHVSTARLIMKRNLK